ncbi:MAG: hypothetical protein ACR2IV_09300 [Bryobacteraceae bacterium]
MRTWALITVFVFATSLGGCSRNSQAERERRQQDQTAGEKAGRAAYWASKKAEKAAKSAAREIGKAARQAHQGWSDAERDDRAKHDRERKNEK